MINIYVTFCATAKHSRIMTKTDLKNIENLHNTRTLFYIKCCYSEFSLPDSIFFCCWNYRHILQCISEAAVYFIHPTKSLNTGFVFEHFEHPVQSQTKYFKGQTGTGNLTAFLFYYKKQNLYIYIVYLLSYFFPRAFPSSHLVPAVEHKYWFCFQPLHKTLIPG